MILDAMGVGRGRRDETGGWTDLLHDTGLSLGESDVATRLVADELDLNLAALAAALLVIIIVVVGGRSALSLDAATLSCGSIAIAGVGVVDLSGRGLVVLGDVGHDDGLGCFREQTKVAVRFGWRCVQSNPIVCITQSRLEKAKSGGDAVLVVVPMDLY